MTTAGTCGEFCVWDVIEEEVRHSPTASRDPLNMFVLVGERTRRGTQGFRNPFGCDEGFGRREFSPGTCPLDFELGRGKFNREAFRKAASQVFTEFDMRRFVKERQAWKKEYGPEVPYPDVFRSKFWGRYKGFCAQYAKEKPSLDEARANKYRQKFVQWRKSDYGSAYDEGVQSQGLYSTGQAVFKTCEPSKTAKPTVLVQIGVAGAHDLYELLAFLVRYREDTICDVLVQLVEETEQRTNYTPCVFSTFGCHSIVGVPSLVCGKDARYYPVDRVTWCTNETMLVNFGERGRVRTTFPPKWAQFESLPPPLGNPHVEVLATVFRDVRHAISGLCVVTHERHVWIDLSTEEVEGVPDIVKKFFPAQISTSPVQSDDDEENGDAYQVAMNL